MAGSGSPMTGLLFEHVHGAVTRVGVAHTAVQHREPGNNLVMTSVRQDPSQTDANVDPENVFHLKQNVQPVASG